MYNNLINKGFEEGNLQQKSMNYLNYFKEMRVKKQEGNTLLKHQTVFS